MKVATHTVKIQNAGHDILKKDLSQRLAMLLATVQLRRLYLPIETTFCSLSDSVLIATKLR